MLSNSVHLNGKTIELNEVPRRNFPVIYANGVIIRPPFSEIETYSDSCSLLRSCY